MEAENDTSTPVNYEQSGGGGDVEPPGTGGQGPVPPTCPQHGWLDRKGTGNNNRRRFTPACRAPWTVKFHDGGGNTAESRPIQQNESSAQVILNEDWTVTVDPAGPND